MELIVIVLAASIMPEEKNPLHRQSLLASFFKILGLCSRTQVTLISPVTLPFGDLASSSSVSAAVGTARTYALIGLIFYAISAVITLGGIGVFLLLTPFRMDGTSVFPIFPLVSLIFLVSGIVGIGLALWSWFTFRSIERGLYAEARTPSIVLGILGLFFAWLIGGIFFILAYVKLGEIVGPRAAVPPTVQKFCVNCGSAVPADAKFCSHCGRELPP